jgi:hypothetical protein
METVFSRSWSWFNEEHIWKPFHQDHDHDEMKHLYRNLSCTIMIMIEWRTYMETFHSRSWSWFNEEYIWHYIMIMILKERFLYTFFKSWSWSWRKCFHICSLLNHENDFEGTVSIFVLHYIMIMKKYMETSPSRSWSWFNEERI